MIKWQIKVEDMHTLDNEELSYKKVGVKIQLACIISLMHYRSTLTNLK